MTSGRAADSRRVARVVPGYGFGDREKRLRQQLVKAKELRAQALKELKQLKADNEALVGALHQVVMENRQLGSS